MELEKREIIRAIAEMAYVMAKAEHGISAEERIAFFRIIEEEMGTDSWIAQSHFELLDEVTLPALNNAYNAAIFELRKHREHFTPDLKERAVRVLQRVAESFGGTGENEAFVLDRFKHDIKSI
jgi:hypothetical protein